MEQLLHYVWKHKIFPLKELKTTTGQQVEVYRYGTGEYRRRSRFFNAKLKLDGVLWIGNIEIHERSSDWFKHGHHADAGYNSVILHIASEIDTEISRSNGEESPKYNSSARKRSAPTTRNCWKQTATPLVTASFLHSPLSPPTHG
mgnify:CR=1 FL=1